MWCGWSIYIQRAFEAQAGKSPLQGQCKPPAKPVVMICICAGYRKIKIQAVAKLICQVLPKCTGDDRR